ncbi:CaiB/BaiF CoA-transferase family protein [Kribbella speibonae]|uniref:CoA transferase n=1 Tax=Kribbella speibonae TaxID=1572660 RepID=A0A4R0I9J6_9ACTN|nr:CoA transferase [Kribbella speibonae]TCC28949.1 CoA transferase [Kribbella speibonae]
MSRLRVLDLTDDLARSTGRLFVGMGADVIRIERERTTDRADRLHWHAGQRVLRSPDDAVLDVVLNRLLPGADVVLESGPLDQLRTLKRRGPAWQHVAHVVVTPFGTWGPCKSWRADDLVATAAGGMAWLGGTPGEAPEPPPREQAGQLAGTHAAIAAMLALIAKQHTGVGQLAEISVQEVVAATLETGAIAWIHAGTIPGRTSGVYGHVAHRVFAAKDGYLAGGYSGPNRMWDDLLAWMADDGAAADLTEERWQDAAYRWEHRPYVDEVVGAFVARHTAEEIAAGARDRGLPWATVAAPPDVLANPQLLDRQFFLDIDTASGPVQDVGFPFGRRPARLREPQDVDATVRWLDREPTAPPSRRTTRGAALDGVRVLDLTWVLAGPYATKLLAEHGADIIKVESMHRQDPTRFAPSMRLRPDATYDDSGYFLNFNRNKRSLALNLRTPRGQELLRRLASTVDVVIENFSPGVLDRWGLGYQHLREINPNVVLVSMAGVGQTGPWRKAVTFADTLAAMSGLTYETGRPPQGLTFGLGDMVAANAAALATLDLLHQGVGGHVDLSQLEAMAAHLGPAVLEPHQLRDGSRILRTAGDDRWIAIGAVPDDALAATIGTTVSDLADYVAQQDADTLAARLQALNIPAYPVRDGRDLVEHDPQLAAGNFYQLLDHPIAGPVLHEGMTAHLHSTPGGLRHPAPLLGQHTDELLTELLHFTPEQLADLHDEGVLE